VAFSNHSLAFVAAAALVVGGCSTPAAPAAGPRPAAVGGHPAPLVIDPSGKDAYELEVTPWTGPVGAQGEVVVAIEARGDHKINVEYPHKLSLREPPAGLTLPRRELRFADAKLDGDKRMTYAIPVSSDRSGEFLVTGSVKLSVCNEEHCIIKTQPLSAKVTTQ